MRIGYRKRMKIAPGVSLNLGRSGVGVAAGPKGAKVSSGPTGKRASFSLFGFFSRKKL